MRMDQRCVGVGGLSRLRTLVTPMEIDIITRRAHGDRHPRSVMSQHRQSRLNKHCIAFNMNLLRRKHAPESKSTVHLSICSFSSADAHRLNFFGIPRKNSTVTPNSDSAARGRRWNLLRTIISLGRCVHRELRAGFAQREPHFTRCEHKKPKHVLDNEIKLTSSEAKLGYRSLIQRSMLLRFQCYPKVVFFSRNRQQC